ncbi:MAG: AAA family ATPase, partial [Microthrixaceae bacterium]
MTELTIANFKAFGERQIIPLAPITLVFGSNSAGKSSLIQALLLMRQSLGSSENRSPERSSSLTIRGELTDLGSFDALLHRHERDRELEIGWTSSTGRLRADRDPSVSAAVRYQRPGEEEEFELTGSTVTVFGQPVPFSAVHLTEFDFLDENESRASRNRFSDQQLLASAENTVRLLEVGYPREVELRSKGRRQPALGALPALESLVGSLQAHRAILSAWASAGLPARAIGLETDRGLISSPRFGGGTGRPDNEAEDELLLSSLHVMETLLRSTYSDAVRGIRQVEYLGPMRQAPERIHVLSGERVTGSGTRGQHVVDLLARDPALLTSANEWFERLEIPYLLEVLLVSDQSVAGAIGDVHCLLLKDRTSGIEVAPTDVGFGIGQVLPVVVESLVGSGTLCIEQPEIHLHPALQARLAELF